jgi:signal peptidase I
MNETGFNESISSEPDEIEDYVASQREYAIKNNLLSLFQIIFCVLLILVIAFTLKRFCFEVVSVQGKSMENTLYDGDLIMIGKLKKATQYDRYDIIVFKPYSLDDESTADEDESEMLYIKRIIGLPGETITIHEDGSIVITSKNGETTTLTDDTYGTEIMTRGINWDVSDDDIFETVTLDDDEYFVLGDNRGVSLDSRSVKVQAVHASSILGRYKFTVKSNSN